MRIPLEWLKQYIEIDKSAKDMAESFTSLGLMLEKQISDDILELEHRMDRSDWLSIIGCARDLAAYENARFKLPEMYNKKGKDNGGVKVRVECPQLVHRFNTRVFRGVKVKESPKWLKNRLMEYGMTPINNIVDITNYVMIEIGNPLHAQDLSKFQKQEIIIRIAKDGEEITTLDGTVVKLDKNTFVLTQNDKPIVIGGIVGGLSTAVDFNTTDIVLDAGNYSQASVRKTARKLKIQNETVLRYDKYLHPKLTEWAIARATQLILELAGGEYYENEDYYPKPYPKKDMTLRLSRIKKLSGLDFNMNVIKRILTALDYEIIEEENDSLRLKIPFFRTDIEVEDDIAADILRINGYHKIPAQLIQTAPPKDITPELYKFEDKIRDSLTRLGLHEHISDPIVSRNAKNSNQVVLENALSSDKNALRTSIFDTLHSIVEEYRKHRIPEVGIFEIGKVYKLKGNPENINSYSEPRRVTVIYESELSPYDNSIRLREILSGLLLDLGIRSSSVLKNINIQWNSFTLDTEELMNTEKTNMKVLDSYQNLVIEEATIPVPLNIPFGPIFDKILNFNSKINNAYVVGEYINKKQNTRSVSVKLEFLEKETTKEEAAEIKEKLLESLK